MAQFAFTAKDPHGNTIQGNLAADSMTLATSKVEQMGYVVISVQAVPEVPGGGVPQQQPASPPYPSNASQPTTIIPSPPNRPLPTSLDPTRAMSVPPPSAPPAQEPTRTMPSANKPADIMADTAQRRKAEADLQRLGMSAEEIRRLLNADAATYDAPNEPLPQAAPPPISKPASPLPTSSSPATKKQNRNAAAASLESFAAELMTANAAKNKQEVQNVNLELPPFRESSTQEKIQSEALLRDASMLRRRERYKEAEAKCREALNLTPSDAAALELLGDLLQGVARTPEALAAYKRATEADPKRASAERKYADLLSRQQNWGNYNPEEPPRNTFIAIMLSALLPGAGQIYCEQWAKGVFFLIATAVCTYLLAWSPFGFQGERRHGGINPSLMVTVGIALILYVVCIVDARISALNYGKRGGSSGWEV